MYIYAAIRNGSLIGSISARDGEARLGELRALGRIKTGARGEARKRVRRTRKREDESEKVPTLALEKRRVTFGALPFD